MFCTNCDYSKELKGKKVVHKYDESGLKNVVLKGVTEYRCPNCGESYFNFGDLDQLHRLLADILLSKDSSLNGSEVRFLRTYIGYSGAFFAKVLGIERETLSRIENGRQGISRTLDRHIRDAVFNKAPDRNYDLHDAILNKPTRAPKSIELRIKKGSWMPNFSLSAAIPSPG